MKECIILMVMYKLELNYCLTDNQLDQAFLEV